MLRSLSKVLPVVALFLSGCPLDDPREATCLTRTGGALVTIEVVGEAFTAWVEDDAFIDEALAVEGRGEQAARVPLFEQVRPGAACGGDWSWHVDPARVAWADFTIELCDARPSYVEQHLDSWIDEVGSWCPWSASVVEVVDLR